MDSPKKNPDNLNTIGIVTVGLVGAALVYLSIVGLQAFYVDETAIVDEVRSFGDQEKVRVSLKAAQTGNLTDFTRKGVGADGKPVVSIGIDSAKALVVRDARTDAANLVPMVGRSETSTIQPIFGRPVALPPPPPVDVAPPADGAVPGAVPPDGATPAGTPPGGTTPAGTAPSQPTPGTGTPNAPAGTPQPVPAPAVQPSVAPPPAAAPATPRTTPPAGGQ